MKDGNGRWSDKVYLYNQESSYYFAKRALGGFSIERSGGPLLRRKYVIPKIPTRFAWAPARRSADCAEDGRRSQICARRPDGAL